MPEPLIEDTVAVLGSHGYLVVFQALRAELCFELDSALTYTGVKQDGNRGTTDTATITVGPVKYRLFLVTWQESDKATVVQLEDCKQNTTISNTAEPNGTFSKYHGRTTLFSRLAEEQMLIGIPVYDGVDMLDVTGPYEMFGWADLDVQLVAEISGPISCRGGLIIQVTAEFRNAPIYDVLWVPGGDPEALACLMGDPDRTYLDFLIRQSTNARYVASVCEGALLLAAAGLLDGYEATTHWAFIPCLTERFPQVRVVAGHPRFCLDRNRLTGGGISSGLDEALELIQLLKGTSTAQSVQQTTQYYPNPPVSSEIPPATTCPIPAVMISPPRPVPFRRTECN